MSGIRQLRRESVGDGGAGGAFAWEIALSAPSRRLMLIGSLSLMLGGMTAAAFTASRADTAAAAYAATAVRTGVAATQ